MRYLLSTSAGSILAIFAVAACSNSTAPERAQRAAENLWAQRGPASYDITVSRGCECLPDATRPAVVSVRDGIVTSRTYVSDGATVGLTYAESYPTVDGLFKKIDDARRQNPATLNVDYDPVLGFPTRIAIDYNLQMADDELYYQVSDFHQR